MFPDTTNPHSAALDAAFDWSHALISGLQGLVELNVQTVKTSLAEQQALTDAALSARSVSEIVDLQSQQWPAAIKKGFAYWRHAHDVMLHAQGGMLLSIHDQVAARLQPIKGMTANAVLPAVSAGSTLIVADEPVAQPVDPVEIVDSAGQVVHSEGSSRKPH